MGNQRKSARNRLCGAFIIWKEKKKSRGIALLLASVMLFTTLTFPVGAAQPQERECPYSDLMLYVDLWQISAVGHQIAWSNACSCFALAYARTVTDGYAHSFSEYNVYGDSQYMVSAAWSLGDYYRLEYADKSEALRDMYFELLDGRPVIACVLGRGSTQHFVTVVGFENVTSIYELSEDNFLILDPIPASVFSVENMGEVGYRLKQIPEGYDLYNGYLLVRPFDNVPAAPIDYAVSSNLSYLKECSDYPTSAFLTAGENCVPYTLPCSPDIAGIYGCVSERRYDISFTKGETIETVGLYENTEGEYWYRIACSDGTEAFLPAEQCVMKELLPPRLEGGTFPAVISGATFLEGEIITNALIDSVQAKVYRTGDEGGEGVISSQLVAVGEKSYSLKYSLVDYTLPFQDLKKSGAGQYTLAYEVTHGNHYVENGVLYSVTECDTVGEFFFRYEQKSEQIEEKNVTVTFDPNGGTCSVSEKTVKKGQTVGTLPTAERAGYTFAGWYTAKDGGERVSADFVVSQDTVLAAHWESVTHRHAYIPSFVDPTCTEMGYIEHRCSCGSSFTSDSIAAAGHSYIGGICVRCGFEDDGGAEDTYDVVFTLGNASGKVGETVLLPLNMESRTEMNSFALHSLAYDTELLEFVGFANTEDTESMAFLYNFDAELGIIAVGLESPMMLTGKLCDLVFRIREGAEGESSVGFSSLVKLDSEMISACTEGGTVAVHSWKAGDMDGNGEVTIEDALLLYLHGMMPDLYPIDYPGKTDVNGDGQVDIGDALHLFLYSMMPDRYPIE